MRFVFTIFAENKKQSIFLLFYMKKNLFILFVFALLTFVNGNAQIRGNHINVVVTPDHKDWNYQVGEKCTFTVNVLKSGTLLDNVNIDYEAGPEMYPDVKKSNILLKDGKMTFSGSMKKALVFAGGGSKGAYQIGAWKALEELGDIGRGALDFT